MKLLYCANCGDVRALQPAAWCTCNCGASRGMYLDDRLHAVLEGDHAMALGFANATLTEALAREAKDVRERVRRHLGHTFSAFVVPWAAETVVRARPEHASCTDAAVNDSAGDLGKLQQSSSPASFSDMFPMTEAEPPLTSELKVTRKPGRARVRVR